MPRARVILCLAACVAAGAAAAAFSITSKQIPFGGNGLSDIGKGDVQKIATDGTAKQDGLSAEESNTAVVRLAAPLAKEADSVQGFLDRLEQAEMMANRSLGTSYVVSPGGTSGCIVWSVDTGGFVISPALFCGMSRDALTSLFVVHFSDVAVKGEAGAPERLSDGVNTARQVSADEKAGRTLAVINVPDTAFEEMLDRLASCELVTSGRRLSTRQQRLAAFHRGYEAGLHARAPESKPPSEQVVRE